MYVCMYIFCVGKWSILFADDLEFFAVFCKDFGVNYYNTFQRRILRCMTTKTTVCMYGWMDGCCMYAVCLCIYE